VTDEDGCDNPANFNDGLLLGPKGIMAQFRLLQHARLAVLPGADLMTNCLLPPLSFTPENPDSASLITQPPTY
jgi:hypothetical protein